jgi:hypothetical protein
LAKYGVPPKFPTAEEAAAAELEAAEAAGEVPPEEVMKRTKAAMRGYLAESSKGAPRIVAPSVADVQRLK